MPYFPGASTGGGAVDSVNSQTGAVVLDTDDIDDSAAANKYVTAAEKTKLSNTSGVNTGDQDVSGFLPKTDSSGRRIFIDYIGGLADGNVDFDVNGFFLGTLEATNLSGNNTGDNSPNSLYAGLLSSPQILNTTTSNTTITSGYSVYVPDFLEIGNGFTYEIGLNSRLEIG